MRRGEDRSFLGRAGAVAASAALALALCAGAVVVAVPASADQQPGGAVVSTEGGLALGDEAVEQSDIGSRAASKGGEVSIDDDAVPMASAEDLAGGGAADSLMRGIGISVAAVVAMLVAGAASMMLTMRKRKRQ